MEMFVAMHAAVPLRMRHSMALHVHVHDPTLRTNSPAVDAVESAVATVLGRICQGSASAGCLTARSFIPCVARRARAQSSGASNTPAVDAVEVPVAASCARICGSTTRADGLAARPSVSRITQCANARSRGPTDSTTVDAVEGAVAPVLARVSGAVQELAVWQLDFLRIPRCMMCTCTSPCCRQRCHH